MIKIVDKREILKRWGLFWLLLVMIWLPFEDLDARLALSLSGLLGAWSLARQASLRPFSQGFSLLAGAFYGALAPILAIFLILFKTGLHGHGFLEFSPVQLAAALSWWPWTVSLGVFFGFYLSRNEQVIQ
ncbi:MAG: hypothetical protein DWG76_02330 [Chloroflexi bacterium]|nr:hypothetical protein [Chloroflexota bacterium]